MDEIHQVIYFFEEIKSKYFISSMFGRLWIYEITNFHILQEARKIIEIIQDSKVDINKLVSNKFSFVR